jgi:hypothetical protein
MKISELIKLLDLYKAEHGDVEVYLEYDSIAQEICTWNTEYKTMPISWSDDSPEVTGLIISHS